MKSRTSKLLLALLVLGAPFLISEKTNAATPFTNTNNCIWGVISNVGTSYASAINTGGTGYGNNDTLQITNGQDNAIFTVTDNVGPGQITDIQLDSGGSGFQASVPYPASYMPDGSGVGLGAFFEFMPTQITGSSTSDCGITSTSTSPKIEIDFTQIDIIAGIWTAMICFAIIIWLFRRKI